MKKSIFALIMALILCMSAVPAEVMAAEYSGDALKSADNVFGRYRAGGFGTLAEYMSDGAVKAIPADDSVPAKGEEAADVSSTEGDKDKGSTSFNPYVFDVDENGENPRVKLEPGLMGADSDMEKNVLPSGNSSGEAGYERTDNGNTVSPEEFKIDDFLLNDSDLLMNLSWERLEEVIDYNLIISIKKNNTDYLINIMHVIDERATYSQDSQESDLTYFTLNNQACILNGVRIPVVNYSQEQFDTSEGINKANGIVYGDKVMLRLVPVVEDQIPAGPRPSGADISFNFYGNDSPPVPERAVYNLNDSLRLGFETEDLGSKYYEVVGLSEQNPDGSREPININGTSFYVFGKSNVNRSDALIINKTIEGGGLVSDVSFNTTLSRLQFNSTSIMPAVGETVFFAVRSENSGFGYPISDFVGCDVPVLKSAVIFNQTATIDFITHDVKMSYFDIYGFVKNEEGGDTHIGNSTYSEFGRLRCDSNNAEYMINSTDVTGNPVSEIRVSAPIFQFNETAEPLKPGDTLYFTVDTEHGRDPDKAFSGDDETAGFSNLVKTTVKPPKVALKKVRNIKKRKVKATWKKSPVTTITGYQIRYSTSKKFAKSKTTTKTIKGRKKTSAVISRLKKGKKYYFQIRTYKKTSDGKYYSGWSKSKSVKIKK